MPSVVGVIIVCVLIAAVTTIILYAIQQESIDRVEFVKCVTAAKGDSTFVSLCRAGFNR